MSKTKNQIMMTTRMIIRRATEADIPAITRIYNYAVQHTTATFDMEPKSLEDRTQWFHSHSDAFPLIVAEEEGEVTGWASLHLFGERKAYRHTVENAVYIDCDHQGRGIGTALLQELIRLAREQGHHAVLALIVAGNDASERLHRRLGFEQVGAMREVGRKFDRWLDILVYEKILC